jgi:hypothetical protein
VYILDWAKLTGAVVTSADVPTVDRRVKRHEGTKSEATPNQRWVGPLAIIGRRDMINEAGKNITVLSQA